ncbi:Dethiobiotin synthetase [hydrothermal vent metagenome]|uniref:Dethiobiotin synthetase n=1 Tax=hydrothermal vent metagenome TaxID=652676 RepID=A0A1W1CSJ1_9ZZZZ
MEGLFITGTNTEVGKTEVACEILKTLPNAIARKPVETDCNPIAKDAFRLAEITNEAIEIVCPYQYKQCSSPEQANKNLQLSDLIKACATDKFVIVEGAGGFYSPIAKNTLNADFAQELALDIILVVKDELGSVSQTLLTIEAIHKKKLNLKAIILNTFVKNDLNNLSALQQYTNEKIVKFKSDDFYSLF